MAGKADFRSLFKAARGQRETVPAKLTKEQIRQLKAQRAAQEAQQAARQESFREVTSQNDHAQSGPSRAEEQRPANGAGPSMPPPPPRAGPSGGMMAPPPRPRSATSPPAGRTPLVDGKVPFKEDSQMTRNYSQTVGSVWSDASTGAVAHDHAGNNNTVESSRIARLPSGNRGTLNDEQASALPAGFFDYGDGDADGGPAHSESGSVGVLPPGGGPAQSVSEAQSAAASGAAVGASFAANSAGGASSAVEAEVAGVPAGFFEASAPRTHSVEDETDPTPRPRQPSATATSQQHSKAEPAVQGALPKGFFANKDADARARGEEPAKKKTKAETYDEFLVSIADDVKEVEQREEAEAQEAATDRLNREAFEQRMRLQRIVDLRAKKAPSSTLPDVEVSAAEGLGEHLAAAGKKRKRAAAALDSILGDLDAEGDDDDDEEVLDWRAKTV